MGPDLFWVAIFSLGGVAMALLTSLVGLPRGWEVLGWGLLYAFLITVVVTLDVDHPFWTVLVGSVIAGLYMGATEAVLQRQYAEHNPWYELPESTRDAALGFVVFAVSAGALFGVVFGGAAWALSLL